MGDGVENPGNVGALRAAASMFGWDYAADVGSCETVLALENAPGADSVYGFRPPTGRLALVVGNERRGISPAVLALAQRKVQIPLASRRLNTINVAAAAAVALYYLSRGGGGKLHTRADPNRSRPEVLFLGPTDPIELGSAIRSAAAFGWSRVFLEDRSRVWFETDRVTRSFGRGAARRGRNAIHVVSAGRASFEEAVVLGPEGEPLHRVDLARGPEQLIVIPDVGVEVPSLARRIRYVSLPPSTHYRLAASVVLAEVARQVGQRRRPGLGRPRPPFYGRTLETVEAQGVLVDAADLPG